MANRIERILSNARLTLADPKKERWDDETLLAILNEAQIDFCQQTQMLHGRITVPITLGNPYFKLPDDCWQLTRVLYENSPLHLITHAELDTTTLASGVSFNWPTAGTNWETVKGIPKAVVYDRRNLSECKLYPIPDEVLDEVYYVFAGTLSESFQELEVFGFTTSYIGANLDKQYGVVAGASSLTTDITVEPSYGTITALTLSDETSNSLEGFGVTTDITDYGINTVFGVVVDLQDDDITTETFTSVFGVLTELKECSSFLYCYYLKNPTDLIDQESELSTPPMYDIALKFYVVGQAFLNDNDAAYQQKGVAQLQMYERHIRTAKKDSSQDFTRAGQFQTQYRRGF